MFTDPAVQNIIKEDLIPKIPGGSKMEQAVSGFLAEPHTLSQGPGTYGSSPGYNLGAAVPGLLENRQVLKPVGTVLSRALQSPAVAGILGAGIGGAGGLVTGALTQRDPTMSALLGALGVGGTAALLSYLANRHSKSAFYTVADRGDAKDFIELKIAHDPNIAFGTKAQLVDLIKQLTEGQLQDLARILKTAAGAGIGMIIARYLLKLGLGGTLLGALAGGFTTSRFSSTGPSISRDVFGNARLLQ